jgi:hypothetical protein
MPGEWGRKEGKWDGNASKNEKRVNSIAIHP